MASIHHSITAHLPPPKNLQKIAQKIIEFYRNQNISFPFRSKYLPGIDYNGKELVNVVKHRCYEGGWEDYYRDDDRGGEIGVRNTSKNPEKMIS